MKNLIEKRYSEMSLLKSILQAPEYIIVRENAIHIVIQHPDGKYYYINKGNFTTLENYIESL